MKNKLSVLLVLLCFISSSYAQKLTDAVEEKNYEAVEKLIEKGEKINKPAKNGQFPLWIAVWNNDIKMVELLLKNGANAKQKFKGKDGEITCLEIAAQEGLLEISKLLINAGANVHERGLTGHTPLRIASRNGRLDLVIYFISLKSEIDTRGDDGATPLEHAATKGHLDILTVLVENGANVNIQDNDGDFPIGEAIKHGHMDVVKYLLSKGADLSLKNKKGYNSIDLAKLSGQPKIEELLKNYLNNK